MKKDLKKIITSMLFTAIIFSSIIFYPKRHEEILPGEYVTYSSENDAPPKATPENNH